MLEDIITACKNEIKTKEMKDKSCNVIARVIIFGTAIDWRSMNESVIYGPLMRLGQLLIQ